MIISLQQGLCGARWSCKNVNKECCKPEPKPRSKYCECDHYEEK